MAQIDEAGFVGGALNLAIDAGPALSGDFLFQCVADFVFGLRAEFDVDQVHGAGAQAPADIVARDHEIGASLVDAAHQEMYMGIVGVPVIDGDPVEARGEIGFHLPGEVAGERFEVGHLGRVLGRDDEPEMMPVVLASLGEGQIIGAISPGVEHDAFISVAAHALALEVADMAGQRRRAIRLALMAGDARLDDDAALRGEDTGAAEDVAATPEGRVAEAPASFARQRSTGHMAGALRGGEHLIDVALCPRRARRTDAARLDAEVAVALAHVGAPISAQIAPCISKR